MASAVEARRSPTQAEASGTGQSVAIRPLDAPFGAEVTGIDWERGSDGIVDVLTRAMHHTGTVAGDLGNVPIIFIYDFHI